VLPHPSHAWEVVLELGKLHLELPLCAARMLGEDVEDQLRPVDDSSLEGVLQRSLLRRAQLIVDEKYLRRRAGIGLLELRELPLPDERPRIRMSAMLHDLDDGRNTCSARELPQLGELCLIVAALGKDADDETALRLRPWSGIGLASGHGGIMPR